MPCGVGSRVDRDEAANLVRGDVEVVYTDAGYQGVDNRPEVTGDEHLSTVELRVAARKARLAGMADPDRAIESCKASVRAKVERPFLIVKRDFGFTKIRYRGLAKTRNHLHMLFASANWLVRARAVALTGWDGTAPACLQPARTARNGPEGHAKAQAAEAHPPPVTP